MFFMWQLKNLCPAKVPRVKLHLVAYWIASAVVLVSAFIAIEMGG